MTSKDQRNELLIALDEFLSEYRPSDGGWAPVTKEDWERLDSVIRRLLECKWGRSPIGGCLPVECRLVDRTKHRGLYAQPVPYDPEPSDEDFLEKWQEYKSMVMLNFDLAKSALDTMMKMEKFHFHYGDLQLTSPKEKKDVEGNRN